MSNMKQLTFVIAGMTAAGMVATEATASPPSGITIENIALGKLKGDNQ
jgi:hypothetical protein